MYIESSRVAWVVSKDTQSQRLQVGTVFVKDSGNSCRRRLGLYIHGKSGAHDHEHIIAQAFFGQCTNSPNASHKTVCNLYIGLYWTFSRVPSGSWIRQCKEKTNSSQILKRFRRNHGVVFSPIRLVANRRPCSSLCSLGVPMKQLGITTSAES